MPNQTHNMPNQTQIDQERIYNELLALHDRSPINQGDEKFNFWIRPRATQQTTPNMPSEWYRFNRGIGYTNIGIVKVGSRSALQIVGFHTKDFLSYSLSILNRAVDYPKIQKGTTLSNQDVDVFLKHLTTVFSQTNKTVTNDVDAAQWMYDTYQDFFMEVKKYDLNNNTPFYNILKITDNNFNKNRTINDPQMAQILNSQQQGGNGGPPPPPLPVMPKNIPLNQILYGPPGTGKTYHTVDKSLEILNPSLLSAPRKDQKDEFDKLKTAGRIVFTTFHQSMSYEDFIEGIKPETVGRRVKYDKVPGVFKDLCDKANKDKDNPYVLIIDEINRGNVSQIFGELITLIEPDKRLGNENELTAKLPYSQEEFGVPNNLYIIGTMNTADRSVEALDTALRRRFSFVEMMPKPDLLSGVSCTISGKSRSLKELLEIINQRIVVLKDREHQIGHSYFMEWNGPTIAVDDLKPIFKNNIVPLLQEYFYGNYQNIGLVLGNTFVKKEIFGAKFADGFKFDDDTDTLRLLTDDEWDKLDMDAALTALINE